jgi:tetratricopeptide (TPR) repeat protein
VFSARVLAFLAAAAILAVPRHSVAQQTAFTQALAELTAAIEGIYGDEGALIGPALDRMSAALAVWNREIEAAEAAVATALSGASRADIATRRISLARMYAGRGRFTDALPQLDAAVVLDPRRADVHVLRGLALRALRRHGEAAEAFQSARSLDAREPLTAYYAFQSATTIGNAATAEEASKALADAYRTLAKGIARGKRVPFVRMVAIQMPADGPPLLPLAAYKQPYGWLARGEYETAIAEFRRAAALDPLVADPASHATATARAVAAMRQGRLIDARSLLEHSDALGRSSEAHRILGLIYWAESDYDKGAEQIAAAIRLSPRDERARLALSRILSSAGKDGEAAAALQETLRVLPDSALAHWWLALSHERVNRFADARREFALAASGAVAGESQLHAAVGRSASAAADVAGAIGSFTRAVAANPNDAALHKQLAGSLVQQDRAEEAIVEFVAALLIDAEDAEAHAGIGQIHLNAGRDADAVDALRRATEVAPANHDARYALANALVRLGRTREAAEHFVRVEQAQRQMLADRRRSLSHDVLKEEAALRTAEGRFDAAIALYEKALAVNAADPSVFGHLASLYSKVGRAPDAARARAMYEKMRADGAAPR